MPFYCDEGLVDKGIRPSENRVNGFQPVITHLCGFFKIAVKLGFVAF